MGGGRQEPQQHDARHGWSAALILLDRREHPQQAIELTREPIERGAIRRPVHGRLGRLVRAE
jgi:hypothetical protein